MSVVQFLKNEFASAVTRGVGQYVVIGAGSSICEVLNSSPDDQLKIFTVDENERSESPAGFVPTCFDSQTLQAALEQSAFDRLKASLFVWLGGAGYRSIESVVANLAFIASLPKGSGVVFDYSEERTCSGFNTQTAMDALATRIAMGGDRIKYLIRPSAVMAMLHSLGFRQIEDITQNGMDTSGGHLVSAVI